MGVWGEECNGNIIKMTLATTLAQALGLENKKYQPLACRDRVI